MPTTRASSLTRLPFLKRLQGLLRLTVGTNRDVERFHGGSEGDTGAGDGGRGFRRS